MWRKVGSIGSLMVALGASLAMADTKPESPAETVYAFKVKDLDGKDVDLAQYKGQVVLIVNTASQCGFTQSTYPALESVYKKYKDQGFVVLAFPSNDFGNQEPLDNAGLKKYCADDMKVTFPTFAKVSVKGEGQIPLYTFLTKHPNKEIAGDVPWNFTKYVVGRDGKVIAKHGPRTLPDDKKVTTDIEKALAAPRG